MLILDSGAVTRLAERSRASLALILALRDEGLWPPRVPSVVLVECAALLRRRARRGSAIDALVVAMAEPGGTVLTTDPSDLEALATYAHRVAIERV